MLCPAWLGVHLSGSLGAGAFFGLGDRGPQSSPGRYGIPSPCMLQLITLHTAFQAVYLPVSETGSMLRLPRGRWKEGIGIQIAKSIPLCTDNAWSEQYQPRLKNIGWCLHKVLHDSFCMSQVPVHPRIGHTNIFVQSTLVGQYHHQLSAFQSALACPILRMLQPAYTVIAQHVGSKVCDIMASCIWNACRGEVFSAYVQIWRSP